MHAPLGYSCTGAHRPYSGGKSEAVKRGHLAVCERSIADLACALQIHMTRVNPVWARHCIPRQYLVDTQAEGCWGQTTPNTTRASVEPSDLSNFVPCHTVYKILTLFWLYKLTSNLGTPRDMDDFAQFIRSAQRIHMPTKVAQAVSSSRLRVFPG